MARTADRVRGGCDKCPKVYPLRDWVVRGAAVRCSIGFTLDDVPFKGWGSLTIESGYSGRVLTVDDHNVRVYIGSPDPKTPLWQGQGLPVEPYQYVDHMRGDFNGLWEQDPPQKPCKTCGFHEQNDRHWNGRVHADLVHDYQAP